MFCSSQNFPNKIIVMIKKNCAYYILNIYFILILDIVYLLLEHNI